MAFFILYARYMFLLRIRMNRTGVSRGPGALSWPAGRSCCRSRARLPLLLLLLLWWTLWIWIGCVSQYVQQLWRLHSKTTGRALSSRFYCVCVLGNYCVRVHVPWKIQPPNSPCSCVCFSAKNCCTNLNPHHRNFCYVSHVLCCCQCYRHETTQYDFLVPRTSPCGDHTSSDYFTTIFPTGIYTPFMCHWYTHRTTATTVLHYFQGWCCPLSLWFTPCERHPRFGGIKNNLTLRTDQIDHDLDNIDNLDPQPAVMTCCAGSVYEQ